jgi:hypothetical protein
LDVTLRADDSVLLLHSAHVVCAVAASGARARLVTRRGAHSCIDVESARGSWLALREAAGAAPVELATWSALSVAARLLDADRADDNLGAAPPCDAHRFVATLLGLRVGQSLQLDVAVGLLTARITPPLFEVLWRVCCASFVLSDVAPARDATPDALSLAAARQLIGTRHWLRGSAQAVALRMRVRRAGLGAALRWRALELAVASRRRARQLAALRHKRLVALDGGDVRALLGGATRLRMALAQPASAAPPSPFAAAAPPRHDVATLLLAAADESSVDGATSSAATSSLVAPMPDQPAIDYYAATTAAHVDEARASLDMRLDAAWLGLPLTDAPFGALRHAIDAALIAASSTDDAPGVAKHRPPPTLASLALPFSSSFECGVATVQLIDDARRIELTASGVRSTLDATIAGNCALFALHGMSMDELRSSCSTNVAINVIGDSSSWYALNDCIINANIQHKHNDNDNDDDDDDDDDNDNNFENDEIKLEIVVGIAERPLMSFSEELLGTIALSNARLLSLLPGVDSTDVNIDSSSTSSSSSSLRVFVQLPHGIAVRIQTDTNRPVIGLILGKTIVDVSIAQHPFCFCLFAKPFFEK